MGNPPIDEIAAARTSRKTSNLDVTPLELLNLCASDLQQGTIRADGLYIVAFRHVEDGGIDTSTYRSGLDWKDETVLLASLLHERVGANRK